MRQNSWEDNSLLENLYLSFNHVMEKLRYQTGVFILPQKSNPQEKSVNICPLHLDSRTLPDASLLNTSYKYTRHTSSVQKHSERRTISSIAGEEPIVLFLPHMIARRAAAVRIIVIQRTGQTRISARP